MSKNTSCNECQNVIKKKILLIKMDLVSSLLSNKFRRKDYYIFL